MSVLIATMTSDRAELFVLKKKLHGQFDRFLHNVEYKSLEPRPIQWFSSMTIRWEHKILWLNFLQYYVYDILSYE